MFSDALGQSVEEMEDYAGALEVVAARVKETLASFSPEESKISGRDLIVYVQSVDPENLKEKENMVERIRQSVSY